MKGQLASLSSIANSFPSLRAQLAPLAEAEKQWRICEAGSNDYTIHSWDELQREVEMLETRATKRRLFIESQVCCCAHFRSIELLTD